MTAHRSYTLHAPSEVVLGTHVASIIDAVGGMEAAHFAMPGGARFSLPIGVPICSGCDGLVADDGYCASCEEPAHWRDTIAGVKPRSLAPVRPILAAMLPPEEMTEVVHRIAGSR